MDDIGEFYANLLINQYQDKPHARDEIKAFVRLFDNDDIALRVRDAFGYNTAVGQQLDFIDAYIGVGRFATVGGTRYRLTDDELRFLIRLKTAINRTDSTFIQGKDDINFIFEGNAVLIDNMNMSISYIFNNEFTYYLPFLIEKNLLPRPMGVYIAFILVAPKVHDNFGFATYYGGVADVSGFNEYYNPLLPKPEEKKYFLSYTMKYEVQ